MVLSLSKRSYFLTFQVVGNLHVSIEVLIIDVITERIGVRQSFKTRTETLSIPRTLFDCIDDILRSMSTLPMYSNETDHPKGFLVFS